MRLLQGITPQSLPMQQKMTSKLVTRMEFLILTYLSQQQQA